MSTKPTHRHDRPYLDSISRRRGVECGGLLPPHRPLTGRQARAGFTLVEIVVAFIIIGILTAIMVPTIARRSEDAKITAAQQDLQHLCDAEERVAIDIGYVVRPYALNDVREGDGIANALAGSHLNGFADNNNDIANNPYSNPEYLFISLSTQNFLGLEAGQEAQIQGPLFDRLNRNETDYSVQTQWRGPYMNWSRDVNHNDWPDDPWGNNYLFFSKIGVLYPPDLQSTNADLHVDHSYAFQPTGPVFGQATNGMPATPLFDRFTVLSLGPNGLPGDGTGPNSTTGRNQYGQGDDIYRQFGGQ